MDGISSEVEGLRARPVSGNGSPGHTRTSPGSQPDQISAREIGAEEAERFGGLLRRTRERLMLTQDQLAGRCGLSGRTIRRLETGESGPQLSTLRSLAEALELDRADRDRFRETAGFGLGAAEAAGFDVLLQGARERALLTQEQLAEHSGVSLRVILRLEAGHSNGLMVATLRSLADTLELDPAERDALVLSAVDGRPRLSPESGVSTSAEVPVTFGALLRQVRTRMGLTQEQVLVRAMLSLRLIRRLEAGHQGDLTVATLRSLADALDLEPTERDAFVLSAVDGHARLHLDGKVGGSEHAGTVKEFGALILRTRIQKGMTQESLAERAGVSLRVIRRLEAGHSTGLRMSTLQSLADALNLDPADRDRFLSMTIDRRRLVR